MTLTTNWLGSRPNYLIQMIMIIARKLKIGNLHSEMMMKDRMAETGGVMESQLKKRKEKKE
jgi:hypothetical protein